MTDQWHRGPNVRGGERWDDGVVHLEYLKSLGLKPYHTFLDVGCGSLRTGIHVVRYLNPGKYFGIDQNKALLTAGRGELIDAGLQGKGARLLQNEYFNFSAIQGIKIDYAWAYSLFTHLLENQIRTCIKNVMEITRGVFVATYNETNGGEAYWGDLHPTMHHRHFVRFPGQLLIDTAMDLGLSVTFLRPTIASCYDAGNRRVPWQQRLVAFSHREEMSK